MAQKKGGKGENHLKLSNLDFSLVQVVSTEISKFQLILTSCTDGESEISVTIDQMIPVFFCCTLDCVMCAQKKKLESLGQYLLRTRTPRLVNRANSSIFTKDTISIFYKILSNLYYIHTNSTCT